MQIIKKRKRKKEAKIQQKNLDLSKDSKHKPSTRHVPTLIPQEKKSNDYVFFLLINKIVQSIIRGQF
jgi:hypothetical protein